MLVTLFLGRACLDMYTVPYSGWHVPSCLVHLEHREEETTGIFSWVTFVYSLLSTACLCSSVAHIVGQWSLLYRLIVEQLCPFFCCLAALSIKRICYAFKLFLVLWANDLELECGIICLQHRSSFKGEEDIDKSSSKNKTIYNTKHSRVSL